MNTIQNIYNKDFLTEIRHIVDQARQKAYSAINSARSKRIGRSASASLSRSSREKTVRTMGRN